ncbi:5181_t:CDS:2 [Acaulospora colombiana]|uniref:5181_t:CDS:1 n=1 Tax=Acaulospora colombiana TaxID=27376 RepID=A0ACA9KDK2_9GLOM|nr:5181_t:CDS:2 [Acaulospora colombiana]
MIEPTGTPEPKKGRWPKHDSDLLEHLVEKYGENWKRISTEIGNPISRDSLIHYCAKNLRRGSIRDLSLIDLTGKFAIKIWGMGAKHR